MYEIVHDLAGCGVFRIQIEILRCLIVRHMMIDVEHAHGIDGIEHRTCALQLHIADDEKIGSVAHPLGRTLNLLHPRQDAKGAGNLIVNQDTRILALLSQIVHQPERRSDAIPIGTDVRGEDDGLRVGNHLRRLFECDLHTVSSFSPAGLSS